MVQWLRLRASNAGGAGPGWGTKIPHAAWCGQKLFKKCFNKSYIKMERRRWREAAEGLAGVPRPGGSRPGREAIPPAQFPAPQRDQAVCLSCMF